MLRKFWNDEAGFVISSELILIATVLVIGMLAGLVTVRDQVIQELGDVAAAMSDTDQSYSFARITGHSVSVAGSFFNDNTDFCDVDGDPASTGQNGEPACIDIVFQGEPDTE